MIYTNSDGGSRGNPGPSAIGVIIRKDEEIITKYTEKIDDCTNNVAEYMALIKALGVGIKIILQKKLRAFLDSELLVRQFLGEYQIKSPDSNASILKSSETSRKF